MHSTLASVPIQASPSPGWQMIVDCVDGWMCFTSRCCVLGGASAYALLSFALLFVRVHPARIITLFMRLVCHSCASCVTRRVWPYVCLRSTCRAEPAVLLRRAWAIR